MSSLATIATPPGSAPTPIHLLNRRLDLPATSHAAPTVFIVEGDVDLRQSLELLIRSQGWEPQACDSVGEFFARERPFVPSVLILAFSSTDSNGVEVQKRIARECGELPIVITADFEDIPTAVQAMKAGAVDFLVKPFNRDLLLAAIRQSLARSHATLDRAREMHGLRNCYASLTPREQQVMGLVVLGLVNKQVGGELGISEITVKAHRGQVMQKMRANSFAHLVNMGLRLRLKRSLKPIALSA